MSTHTTENSNSMDTLADDARALLAATADVAEEKVIEARQRVAAVLDKGREFYGAVREKAVEGAKVANQTVRTHPYESIGLALGIGALLGWLITRRK